LTGAGVVSFNGRFGTVNPAEGDYTLTQLGDVIITSPSNGQVLKYNGSNWVNASDVTEADTLDTVTTRGNTTANSITVGSVTAAGLSNLLGQIRTFATTGNTYIGANPGSATDAGFKLDVNGTTRLNGNTTVTGVLTGSDTIRSTNGTVTVSLSYGSTAGIIGTTSNHSLEIRTNNTYRVGVSTAGVVNIANLIGTGSRMVVADSAGNLSTQAIPDLSGYLPLSGGTLTGGLIGTTGSFASSGSGDTFAINHSSGSGIALNITKGGNGEGLYINKTGGSGNAATIIGTLNATTLVKSGGTSSQFLKADGSVDSNTYATDSSVVHISGTETITGAKTFSNVTTFNQNIVGGIIKLSQGVLLSKSAAVGTDAGFLSLIATSATGLNYINIADGDAPSNTQRFAIPNTGTYTYTFPAASGTVALASDIPSLTNYVTLDGTQTITGLKTFSGLLTANGNIKATYYGFADSNGYSTGFESQSNNTIQVKIGSGLAINIASNNNTTFYGNIIRNGGTSSQFLKADGSLDSSTYATTSSLSSYLPLSGGTLTGGLNGTTASFSGYVTATGLFAYYLLGRSSDNYGAFWFGSNNGATRYGYIQSGSDNGGQVVLNGDGGGSITLDNRGMNVTGAATFSSSVTAGTQFIGNNSITDPTAGITTGTVFALNGASSNNTFGIGVAAVRNGNYDIWFQTGSINGGGYRFYKGTSEIVTITSAGELLVGTTSRVTGLSGFTQLEVSGSEGGITINSNTTTTDKFSRLMFTKGGATGNEGLIRYNVNDYHMAFFTNAAERMRITSDGKVNIDNMLRVASDLTSGKINIGALLNSGFNGITIQTYQSPASGNFIEFLNLSGNSAGNITHTGTTTVAYNTSSDYRLKEDLKDFNGIDKIKAINVYDFKWKEEENRMFGVLAHELKEVLPYAVSGEKDAVYEDGRIKSQGVDYSFLTPLLVKAIQEQQAQIESLKARLK
jgi:hypothetical protein